MVIVPRTVHTYKNFLKSSQIHLFEKRVNPGLGGYFLSIPNSVQEFESTHISTWNKDIMNYKLTFASG